MDQDNNENNERNETAKWQDSLKTETIKELFKKISTDPNAKNLDELYTCLNDKENIEERNDAKSVFFYYIAKSNVIKTKNEFINKITKGKTDLKFLTEIILECADEYLKDITQTRKIICSPNSIYILPVVNLYFQITYGDNPYIQEVLDITIPLYDTILEIFIKTLEEDEEVICFKNENMLSLVNNAIKQVLWIFVKRPETPINDFILKFLDHCYKILSYNNVTTDMKTKCGLIFVHCLGRLSEEERKLFVFSDHPMLEVTNTPEDKEKWICGKSFTYKSLLDNISAKVSLFCGLYNCVSITDLLTVTLSDGICVLQSIFEELLKCTERSMKNNPEIIDVSRNILLISDSLNRSPFNLYANIFDRTLSFIDSYCEYPVDAVQKHAILVLGQMIKVASAHFGDGEEQYIWKFIHSVNLIQCRRKIDFVKVMYLGTYMEVSFLLRNIRNLKEHLEFFLEDPAVSEHACTAYELLMKEHFSELKGSLWVKFWVKPAIEKLKTVHIDKIQHFQRIICRAFQISPEILRELFPANYMGCTREWNVLLKCLQYARNTKLPLTINICEAKFYWWGLVEKHKLKLFSVQRDDMVRVSTLRTIVECQKTTEYYSDWEFDFLIEFYSVNGSIQVPSTRKQISSLLKKGIARYFAGLDVIKKQIMIFNDKYNKFKTDNRENDPQKILECLDSNKRIKSCYEFFFGRFMILLKENITPVSNFYRRTLALDLLLYIETLQPEEDWNTFWESEEIEFARDILYDTYEINKKMALTILTKIRRDKLMFEDSSYYEQFYNDALKLACDIKPSKSLSAAYMFQLYSFAPTIHRSKAEELIFYGENETVLNLIIALTNKLLEKFENISFDTVANDPTDSPGYGLLVCLRYLIHCRKRTTWTKEDAHTYSLLYEILVDIFKNIMPIVSNPAPEGYLPDNEETEISIRDDTVKSQRVLVYAWRTIKEIILLFSDFVCQNIEVQSHKILSFEDYVKIGDLFLNIFTQAKHRGVFEQAYVGFCPICEAFWKSKDEKISELPKEWLRTALDLITSKEIVPTLCPTRRSAGMPFLILAILTTEPITNSPSFILTMNELMEAASNNDVEMIDSRVHALNILRFMFRHSKLGDVVGGFIEATAKIALNAMNNFNYPIRNAATLFYSALVTRLFGVQRTQDSEEVTVKNKMTVNIFYGRFPDLFDFLVETLKTECHNNSSLILYPVLLMFSRLYPNHKDKTDTKIHEALKYIRNCLRNSSIETRKLAARAAVALLVPAEFANTVVSNFEKIRTKRTYRIGNNECHGLLLEIWYIFKYWVGPIKLPFNDMILKTSFLLEESGRTVSHNCASLYIDILSVIFTRYNSRIEVRTIEGILTPMTPLMDQRHEIITGRQNFEAAMVNLTVSILLIRLQRDISTYDTINYDFENYLTAPNGFIMKTFCLHFLLYMNTTYDEKLPEPSLYVYDKMRPPDFVKNMINNLERRCKCELLTFLHNMISAYLRCEFKLMIEGKAGPVNDCFILKLLLLPYYSCVLLDANKGEKKVTIDKLLDLCNSHREEVKSAVITCISVMLPRIEADIIHNIDFTRFTELLRQCSTPEAQFYCRLSVCHFLISSKFWYYYGSNYVNDVTLVEIFNIIMRLYEDDSSRIRNEVSELTNDNSMIRLDKDGPLSGWQCAPDKSRYDFLKHCKITLPKHVCIAFYLSWCTRHFPESCENSNVFERSELNSYAENVPYIQICGKMLMDLLWTLPFNLDYADGSIFVEEQVELVTITLIDAMTRYQFPIVDVKTRQSMINAFKHILTYMDLHKVKKNFRNNFSDYFKKKVLTSFEHLPTQDAFSVKRIFKAIYSPCVVNLIFEDLRPEDDEESYEQLNTV